jgi:glycosyltransferase involved in cell wall biosynthesis
LLGFFREIILELISVVVPCLNEEKSIPIFISRTKEALFSLSYEIIIVDDGSKDNTFGVANSFAASDPKIKVIKLSRNFGHQMASSAGIDLASGDLLVLIDADLQDPPEVIPRMIKKIQEGFDVVYGKRIKRKGESLFKKISAYFFYRTIRFFSRIEIPVDTGDFRMINRKVINAIKLMPERERFLRGMISWVGFRQSEVLYERHEREHGQTKYNLKKMFKFAIDGITSFSTFPLRIGSYIGLFFGIMSFFLIALQIYNKIFHNYALVQGWTSLVILILITSSLHFLLIGIQGEYVARIFEESKARPKYLIDRKVNL